MLVSSEDDMKQLGESIGRQLRGGECIELLGDVGAGKTTFVKGLGSSLAIDEDVQSPSFTISRQYDARDDLVLAHYDFYRLHEAGVVAYGLEESLASPHVITVVEWGETIGAVLPETRIIIMIRYEKDSDQRNVKVDIPDVFSYIEVAS